MFVDIKLLTVLLAVSPLVMGQQAGTLTKEVHPSLNWQKCHTGGHCTDVHGAVVLDSEFRWLHNSQSQNCFTGSWNQASCPDGKTCAMNCALEGAQYQETYGVSTSGNALNLKYVTHNNVGSRLYLMADEHNYEMFKLLNQEFTFDVDISQLPCGTNGALYFVSMDKDGGGGAHHPTNKAGARFGTGYCDSQCPRGMKFINGEANIQKHGLCCAEMDIWEANSMAAVYTAHPCAPNGPMVCNGDACGRTCDPGGCGFNSYQMGAREFYGPGKKVDTKKKITVVTQFITNDGTAHGHLTEIRRFYVQNGHVIPNSMSTVSGIPGNSLSDKFCADQKKVFYGSDSFNQHGGIKQMGEAIRNGMVLAFALWDDSSDAHMLWLDGVFPKGADASHPGVAHGPCPANSGEPHQLEKQYANAVLTYSNIKIGPINSTFHH